MPLYLLPICSVEYWRYLEMRVENRSRSLIIVPINRSLYGFISVCHCNHSSVRRTSIFDVECLRNGKRQKHSYPGTMKYLHTLYSRVSFRMISDLAKYSVTWNTARPLCDSWAPCHVWMCRPTVSVSEALSRLSCVLCSFVVYLILYWTWYSFHIYNVLIFPLIY